MNFARLAPARTLHLWLPGYGATRLRNIAGAAGIADITGIGDSSGVGDSARIASMGGIAGGRGSHGPRGGHNSRRPIKRVWVTIADHFEPWWRRPDDHTALERVLRWAKRWPEIARRHVDHAGRQACYTFFYPEEQYHPAAIDPLSHLTAMGIADVEVHLHHDADSEASFVDRVGRFVERLHTRHGLLRRDDGGIRFGFIHGNWALDNSLPGGHMCGLDNEITLLRDLGCYADFTLPAAPSPAQTRIVNTIYWAKDDPARPKSHDRGLPVVANGGIAGDLVMIPGPLTLNLREWFQPLVPRLEVGELAGNCRPTRHRVRLWKRAAPRIGEDLFIKLFAHGAPEKNARPLLQDDGVLDRTLSYLTEDCRQSETQLFFVSAWHMWMAVDAIRRGVDPVRCIDRARREHVTRVARGMTATHAASAIHVTAVASVPAMPAATHGTLARPVTLSVSATHGTPATRVTPVPHAASGTRATSVRRTGATS